MEVGMTNQADVIGVQFTDGSVAAEHENQFRQGAMSESEPPWRGGGARTCRPKQARWHVV